MELMRFTRLKANPKTLSLQFFFFFLEVSFAWFDLKKSQKMQAHDKIYSS